MQRRYLAVVLMLVIVMSLTAGCQGGSKPSGGSETGGTTGGDQKRLVVVQPAEPNGLDPHKENDVYSLWVSDHIYDRLVMLDEELNIIPVLAEDWEWLDDTTLEMKIREGVTFHNGEPLTAEDVKYSIQRHQDPETVSPNFARLEAIITEDIEVVDEYTIRFPLKYPSASLLNDFAYSGSAIVNKKAVEEHGDRYTRNPVGTGPFKFVKWESGDYILTERFDDYWGDKAGVEELQFRTVTSDPNRAIEIETGGAHLALEISPNDVDRVANNENLTLDRGSGLRTSYVFLNNKKAPFDNVKVRQAMAHALDLDIIVEAVFEGLGIPADSLINPELVNLEGADIKKYEYDVEKGKQLLEEAGYGDGFEFKLTVAEQQTTIDTAEVIQNQLGEIGITVDIDITEFAALMEKAGKGEHDAVMMSWNCSTGDLNQGARPLFHSEAHGSAGNRAFYTNERVDELFILASEEINDPELRASYYVEIAEILTEDMPMIPTLYGENTVGYRSNEIEGFKLHPNGRHRLDTIRFK